uniref:Uncharacterized protein n=1 Tax=Aquila chrysaetos chrysaetos TaxID=223781 RepID=A0A663FGS1_AQUCH
IWHFSCPSAADRVPGLFNIRNRGSFPELADRKYSSGASQKYAHSLRERNLHIQCVFVSCSYTTQNRVCLAMLYALEHRGDSTVEVTDMSSAVSREGGRDHKEKMGLGN